MEADEQHDAKRGVIHEAAIEQFAARGFTRTSMANIAEAAGMSRPALYQYFRNKGDIFASAFVALFEVRVEAALEALQQPGTTAERLDGFLQRYEGDLWQRMATSTHTDEIMEAKNDEISGAVASVVAELWAGLDTFLAETAADTGADESTSLAMVRGWSELLRLSPKGLKGDGPTVGVFRARLTTLANSVAADIDLARSRRI